MAEVEEVDGSSRQEGVSVLISTLSLAEGVWVGNEKRAKYGANEADLWCKRGARAAMCVGISASGGHSGTPSFFEEKVAVDVRVRAEREEDAFDTCKDGQWENWAAKHEDEEMKAGVWMEPVQAVLRRKTTEAWTEKHQHVTKKLFVEGGWVQKRLYDTCWSGEKKCRGCNHEEGTGKHRLYHCPSWRSQKKFDPRRAGKWDRRPQPRRKIGSGAKSTCQCASGNWKKHTRWSMPVEGFRDHFTTDCFLL